MTSSTIPREVHNNAGCIEDAGGFKAPCTCGWVSDHADISKRQAKDRRTLEHTITARKDARREAAQRLTEEIKESRANAGAAWKVASVKVPGGNLVQISPVHWRPRCHQCKGRIRWPLLPTQEAARAWFLTTHLAPDSDHWKIKAHREQRKAWDATTDSLISAIFKDSNPPEGEQ